MFSRVTSPSPQFLFSRHSAFTHLSSPCSSRIGLSRSPTAGDKPSGGFGRPPHRKENPRSRSLNTFSSSTSKLVIIAFRTAAPQMWTIGREVDTTCLLLVNTVALCSILLSDSKGPLPDRQSLFTLVEETNMLLFY